MLFVKRLVKNPSRSVQTALGVIVAAIILLPMGWQLYAQWAEVSTYLAGVDVKMLFAALGLATLNLGILASVWLLIANRLEVALGLARDLRAFFFSNFAKRVPGTVWYVAGRAYLYRVADGGVWMAMTGTVLENALLLLAGILLALVVWPHQFGLDNSWIFVALPVAASIAVAFSLWPTAILRFARLFQRKESIAPTRVLRLSAKDVLLWIVLCMLVWVVGGLAFHCFVAAFYPLLPLASLSFTVGVSTAYGLSGFVAFFVPAGLGVKELAGAYLLSRVLPTPLAITVMLLFRLNLLLAEGFWLALSHCLERWMRLPSV